MAITRATNLAGLGTVFDALTDGGGLSISGLSTFTDLNITGVSTHDGVSYFTNNVFIDLTGGSSVDAVRINQSGTGNALLIEDQSRPDSSPFVIDTNGDVGIGTTIFSSGVRLSVLESDSTTYTTTSYGRNIELTNGSPGGYSGISFVSEPTGGGNAGRSSIISYCDSAGNSNLVFGVRKDSTAVERVRISSDGYIGVNTAIPGAPFEIRTTDQNPEAIKLYHSVFNSGSSQWGIDFMRDTNYGVRKKSATIKASRDGATATSLIFATSPSDDGTSPELERLRINYDGKVGIGSTNPSSASLVVENPNATDDTFNTLLRLSAQDVTLSDLDSEVRLDIKISPSSLDTANRKASLQVTNGVGDPYRFLLNPSGGRVGINTDDPSATLTLGNVGGDGPTLQLRRDGSNEWFFNVSSTGSNLNFRSGSNVDDNNRVVFASNGNVGIGSDIPAQTLDVRSNDTRFNLTSDGSGQTVGMTLKGGASDGFTYNFIESVSNVDSQNWYIGGAGVANNFAIKTGGTERLRINSSGRIGVGTDTIFGENKVTVIGDATTVGAVAIGGSVSLGSGLKASVWDGAKSSYATNGGLDIYVGNGSHALTVWDDNVSIKPRFEVTRNGIVHQYFQPAFYARKTTGQTLTTTPTTIVYSTEDYDVASNYNNGTYRFTAPADGRYYIHAHYLPNSLGAGGPSLSFTVYVNGSGVNGANDSLFSEAERQTRSIDVILSLSESDYVEIKGSCSSGTHGVDNSGVFCGVKVG